MQPRPRRAGANDALAVVMGSFCSGQFPEDAYNFALVGGTGTGTTHIATALGTTLFKEQAGRLPGS